MVDFVDAHISCYESAHVFCAKIRCLLILKITLVSWVPHETQCLQKFDPCLPDAALNVEWEAGKAFTFDT